MECWIGWLVSLFVYVCFPRKYLYYMQFYNVFACFCVCACVCAREYVYLCVVLFLCARFLTSSGVLWVTVEMFSTSQSSPGWRPSPFVAVLRRMLWRARLSICSFSTKRPCDSVPSSPVTLPLSVSLLPSPSLSPTLFSKHRPRAASRRLLALWPATCYLLPSDSVKLIAAMFGMLNPMSAVTSKPPFDLLSCVVWACAPHDLGLE